MIYYRQIFSIDDYECREFDKEVLLFCHVTGETHLLDKNSAEVWFSLGKELNQKLPEKNQLFLLNNLLANLVKMGLVEKIVM